MAKVKRPASAPAPAARPPAATVTPAKARKSASAGATDAAAKGPAAAAAVSPAPIVIDIPSSPDPSVGPGSKGSNGSKKKAQKRPAPTPFVIDDEVEMWTPRQKQRLDDDCEILAGDPLSATKEVAPSPAAANDEIAVVAERGKVACRDYPHPRSACAKNPFSTTPHESHCDKCFCYVCDIAAPCVSWRGHGGHCHASDKDKKWKAVRLMMKKQRVKPS